MAYKCPRCGLVYDKEENCPLCGWPINVPFKAEKPTQSSIPNMRCPECGKEMEHGILQIDSRNWLAIGHGIRWFKPNEEIHDLLGTGGEGLPWDPPWTRRHAMMCRDCELILLRWTGLAESKKPA